MPPHTYASMYIQFNLVLSHRFFSRRLFAFFESTTFFSCFQQICCCCCCSELMFSLSLECLHTQQYSGNQLAKMSLQIVVPHIHSSQQQPFFFYFCLFTVLRVHNIVMAIYKVLFKSQNKLYLVNDEQRLPLNINLKHIFAKSAEICHLS